MFVRTLVFCAFVAVALAAIRREELEPIPEKFDGAEGCYIREFDGVLPFDAVADSEQEDCTRYYCAKDALIYQSCESELSRDTPRCTFKEGEEKTETVCVL